MRLRSLITVFAMTGLLGAGILRCKLPPEPPGPHALRTDVRTINGAVVAIPGGSVVNSSALVASLKALNVDTVILESSADETGAFVADRVALAIVLQRELTAAVLVGTYESSTRNRKSMTELLQPDATFTACYPGGPKLDASAAVIDNLRICSQAVSKSVADALKAQNASTHIGCSIPQQLELRDALTDDERTKLTSLLHDGASGCTDAGRFVGISPIVTAASGDPIRAGVVLRESIQDAGIKLVSLHDGVGSLDPNQPARATPYFIGLRDALTDREPTVLIFANVEAFACASPACTTTHPTSADRFLQQMCAASTQVEGIVVSEYMQDFAGTPGGIASDASTATDGAVAVLPAADLDASSQLRTSYLAWRDAGGPCPPPLDAGH